MRKPHISIRSGWRCINDGSHNWHPREYGGKRCTRCKCTEAATSIWLITATHPEYGCIQKHCDSFTEALEVVNQPNPIDKLFNGFTVKFGHSLYAM